MSASRWIHIEVSKIIRETDKAFLIRLDDDTEHWIPRSHVSDADDYEEGDVDCSMSISEWIANEKGIA